MHKELEAILLENPKDGTKQIPHSF